MPRKCWFWALCLIGLLAAPVQAQEGRLFICGAPT
jgi:hypothetical protein